MADGVVWKHIGLHGHSVGTFACEPSRIVWKSALTGRDSDIGSSTTRTIPKAALAGAAWSVCGRSGFVRLQTKNDAKLKHEMRFDGFPAGDFDMLAKALKNAYDIELTPLSLSAAGTQYGLTSIKGKNLVFKHCVLDDMNEEGQEFEPRAQDEMLSLDLAEVTQCVLPGNNRNEIEVQFPESDAVEAGTDQLVSIRMYIPPDPDADSADKAAPTAAELLQQRIMQTANIRKTTGDVLVSFDQSKGTFLTPRGRYAIELYEWFLRMRGQKYDYKIKYDDISRLFLLPKPDEVHMAFVIALDKPIRQGQQRYQYLVLQVPKDPDEVTVNLEEEVLQREYGGELQPLMRGSLANLVAKTFKVIAKKKVFIPGKFANANQQACVKCAVRANEGLLYPLEKQFVFIHKPPILVRFNEVESVEFQRYAGGQGSTRNFDLCVTLKSTAPGTGTPLSYTFSGIERSDYDGLYNFLKTKKITIKNLQGTDFLEEAVGPKNPVYNEDEIFGAGPADEGLGEGSEDSDFDEEAAAKEEEDLGSSDSEEGMDDDELGSEVDEDLDSDLEEARKTTKRKKKKSADDEEDGSEMEEEKRKKKKSAKKEKGDSSPPKKKAKKDPNAPKRALTAYFCFSNENRDRIKKENPGIAVSDVAKLLGAEWKSMDAEQKAKYEKMAAADKARYQKEMADYTPPPAAKADSPKKKKDPNAPKRAMTSFFFFSNAMRPKIKEENPDMSFGEIAKKVGELFRELSSEEKEKYEKMATEDKARHKREQAAYKAKQAEAADDDDDSDADGVNEVNDDDDDDSDDDSD